MPSSIVAAGISGWISGAIAAGEIFAFSWGAFASSLVLSGLSQALGAKPQQQSLSFDGSRTVTIRQPISSWQIIYGRPRVGGVITYKRAKDGYYHLIVTFAGHVCEAVDEIWFGAQVLGERDAEGNVITGTWGNVSEEIAAEEGTVPASGPYTLTGVYADAYVAGSGRVERVIVGDFASTYLPMTDVSPSAPAASGEYSVAAGVFSFHASDAGLAVRISYHHKVIDSHVKAQVSLGDEAGQPFPDLVTESGGEWTDAHRQTGRTKIWFRLKRNPDLFPTGVPNITAVIRGRCLVYDPRTASSGYSATAALCVADYMADPVLGVRATIGSVLGEAALSAAANVCDESVALAAGGSEPRYTLNGAFLASERPIDIIQRMLTAMGGHAVKVGASWTLYAGAYETPTLELTAAELAGPIGWSAMTSRRDNANGVRGTYAAPDNFYQPTDFPALQSAAYLAEDQGREAWHDLALVFTDSVSMAQRLAKLDLLRTRQGLTVTYPGKLSAFRAAPGRTVLLTLPKYGWNQKPFWVAGSKFVVRADDKKNPTLGVDLVLRETAAAVFDWSTDEEQAVDIAPNTSLGNPFVIAAPGAPEVTESLYESTGSAGVKARATIWLVAPADSLVTTRLPEYRAEGGAWIALPGTDGDRADIDDIAPGRYEFRYRYRNSLAQRSAYSPATVREIVGLTARPADPSGFTAHARNGLLFARWTLCPDLDVRIGGRCVIRHAGAAAATWAAAIECDAEDIPGDATTAVLPLLAGTYLIKFQDSTGNWSETAASFEPSIADLTGWTVVGTVTEDPGFAGTHSGTEVSGGALQLAAAVLIDDIVANLDDWSDIDSLDGNNAVQPSGTYTFASVMDLTTKAARRFEAAITASAFDLGDVIDSRRAAIDSWDDIDGTAVNDCSCALQIRITDDDPAGTPTWSAWLPMLQGDFDCRAAQFRLALATADDSHNLAVSALAVTAAIHT